MKTEFTKQEMYNLKGCYSKETLDNCSFMSKDNISLQSILDSEIPLKDKSWFIRNSIQLSDIEKRQFAIGCALVVLPIYENKYPSNDAPRKAIEAAEKYLKNEITLQELNIFRKAAAAAAAAYAAYAAAADDDITYKDKLLLFFKEFVSK